MGKKLISKINVRTDENTWRTYPIGAEASNVWIRNGDRSRADLQSLLYKTLPSKIYDYGQTFWSDQEQGYQELTWENIQSWVNEGTIDKYLKEGDCIVIKNPFQAVDFNNLPDIEKLWYLWVIGINTHNGQDGALGRNHIDFCGGSFKSFYNHYYANASGVTVDNNLTFLQVTSNNGENDSPNFLGVSTIASMNSNNPIYGKEVLKQCLKLPEDMVATKKCYVEKKIPLIEQSEFLRSWQTAIGGNIIEQLRSFNSYLKGIETNYNTAASTDTRIEKMMNSANNLSIILSREKLRFLYGYIAADGTPINDLPGTNGWIHKINSNMSLYMLRYAAKKEKDIFLDYYKDWKDTKISPTSHAALLLQRIGGLDEGIDNGHPDSFTPIINTEDSAVPSSPWWLFGKEEVVGIGGSIQNSFSKGYPFQNANALDSLCHIDGQQRTNEGICWYNLVQMIRDNIQDDIILLSDTPGTSTIYYKRYFPVEHNHLVLQLFNCLLDYVDILNNAIGRGVYDLSFWPLSERELFGDTAYGSIPFSMGDCFQYPWLAKAMLNKKLLTVNLAGASGVYNSTTDRLVGILNGNSIMGTSISAENSSTDIVTMHGDLLPYTDSAVVTPEPTSEESDMPVLDMPIGFRIQEEAPTQLQTEGGGD